MTEQQIRDGFERLDGGLAPPLDAQERVARRVTVRRRRRRATVAGAAAFVLVAGVGTTVALSGGDDPDGRTIATDQPPSGPISTLAMTRPDGSTVAFPDVTVSCDPPVANGDEPIDSPAPDRIWAYSPIAFDAPLDDATMPLAPFVLIQGIVSDLEGGRSFTYPIEGPRGASPEPINVFIADTEGGRDGNELSSSVGDTGTVRVLEASCDPVPVLRLEVSGTLASEEGKQSVELAGTLR